LGVGGGWGLEAGEHGERGADRAGQLSRRVAQRLAWLGVKVRVRVRVRVRIRVTPSPSPSLTHGEALEGDEGERDGGVEVGAGDPWLGVALRSGLGLGVGGRPNPNRYS